MTGDRITHELTIGVGEKIYQKKERKSANSKKNKQYKYSRKTTPVYRETLRDYIQ